MKQITQKPNKGNLNLDEVATPILGRRELLIRTKASLISSGTDRLVRDFAKKNIVAKAQSRPDLVKKVLSKIKSDGLQATIQSVVSRLDEPMPFGYSAAGTVIEVGSEIQGAFRVGDRVAAAGAGVANHAELNVVPRNLASVIPEDVDFTEACYGTLSSIAMHSIRNLNTQFGEVVAVIGLGLIGQLACQLLRISGVRVIGLDYNQSRVDLAKSLGAELSLNISSNNLVENILSHTEGIGCDGIIIAAATKSNEPFELTSDIARDRANVCMVGYSGTTFPYAGFMEKELSLTVSRSYGPGRYDQDYENRDMKYPEGFVRWTETANLSESLRLMSGVSPNNLNVKALTTHVYDFEDAETAYKSIFQGSENHLGVVLSYSNEVKAAPDPTFSVTRPAGDDCSIGLIGAGSFAKNVLLPELNKLQGIKLHTVISKRGNSASYVKEKYNFLIAGSSEDEIFENPAINAVIITTQHDSHSSLASKALSKGKCVFVEKPLGLSIAELETVAKTAQSSNGFFQVGFNRRFAPIFQRAKSEIDNLGGPKHMVFRINAGPIPEGSWIQSPAEGGGRIIGEMCHFIDLARYFVGSPIVSLISDSTRKGKDFCDDVATSITFSDGSLVSISYTSLGDSSYPKESYEIYGGGSVLTINNLQKLSITSGGKTKTIRYKREKGIKQELNEFVRSVKDNNGPPIDEMEALESSAASISIIESLQKGQRININKFGKLAND